MPVIVDERAAFGMGPGQNHRPPRPAFANTHGFTFGDDIAVHMHAARFEGSGINQNGAQIFVPARLVGNQQAGLCRDGKPHLIGDLQPIAANELYLVKEQVDLAFKLCAQFLRQVRNQRHLIENDRAFFIGQRGG